MNTKKRNSIVAILLVISMVMSMIPMSSTQASDNSTARVGEFNTEENTGDMNRVPYNNASLLTDLDAGMCAYPVVVDMNEDGYMDLLVYGASAANPGTWIFYGTDDELIMEKGRKLSDGDVISATYLYDAEGNYEQTALHVSGNRNVYDAKDYPITDEDTPIITRDSVNPFQWDEIDGNKNTTNVSSLVSLADYDGDGMLDCINSWDSWYEYGWRYGKESRYDEYGIWGGVAGSTADNVVGVADGENDSDGVKDGDPLHGWVAWSQNTNTATAQQYGNGTEVIQVYDYTVENGVKTVVEGSAHALDVYGCVTTQFVDWDNDEEDLDIICGDFVGNITYFENIGTRTAPVYIEGRPVQIANGEELKMHGHQIITTAFDWNSDGHMDLIVGEEDGRVHFVENTGELSTDGTPIMKEPVCFQSYSDSLDMGVLASIDSVDWDGDGDEDIIGGNSNGYILYIKNLTIEKDGDLENPVFGKPVYLTNPEGEVYRITAGYNGSLQGPSEESFGYTKIDTGDWDGDGVLDIISNNIWGIIMFHKGIKTTDGTFKAENPVPIEVEWTGETPYPSCNWWAPGEETLGVDVTDPAGRFYEAQWSWNDVKSEDELVVQWRTSPCAIDLPLDKDGDGTAEGDGLMDLVLIDHEGYLSFFERYEENGVLKLKEGQRIFKDTDGTSLLRPCTEDLIDGATGRRQFILTDYNKDGKLDYIVNNGMNAGYGENIATVAGEYQFSVRTTLHTRKIAQHVPRATACDWDGDGYVDLLFGDEGGQIYYLKNTIAHPAEEETVTGETLPTDFTRITPADFGIADGTYGADDRMEKKTTWVGSFDEVLFEARISSMTGYYFCFSNPGTGAEWQFLVNSAGDNMRIFDYMTNSETKWLDPTTAFANTKNADKTFANADFQFVITMEYVNHDEDPEGNENDIKYGVWFDGVLYNQTYYYMDNAVDVLTLNLNIYPNSAAASKTITIESPQKTLEDYTYVTASDFGLDGQYNYSAGQEITSPKKPVDTWHKVLFRTTINTTGGIYFYYGGTKIMINFQGGGKIRFWDNLTDSTIYLGKTNKGTSPFLEPATALGNSATTFNNQDISLAITTEYVDYDGGLAKNDLKMGIWFNGELYSGEYFYLTNITSSLSNTIILNHALAGTTTFKETPDYEVIVIPEITDSIAMNYIVTVDPLVLKTGDASMSFDMNGADTIKLSEEDLVVENNVFRYTYTDIMGQDMAEKIIAKLTIGSTVKTYEYSVLDYCVDVLKADTLYESDGAAFSVDKLAATKDLVVDLVQYGAAVQTYRGVAENKLHTTKLAQKVTNYLQYDLEDDDASALANLTPVESKLTTEDSTTSSDAYAWQSVGLVLNNKVKIRGTFTASDVSNLTVKAVINGTEQELTFKGTSKSGIYEVDFDEIYAYEYAEEISFRFYEGTTQVGKTLNYSVNTYLKEMCTYSDKLAALLLAIHNYGDAAIAYQDAQ